MTPLPTPCPLRPMPLLLHPHVLPLILIHCNDHTTARLMRVSRSILAEIVSRRWPIITLDMTRIYRTPRTSLPEDTTDFSLAMAVLLAQYAKIVRITPHHANLCPPTILWYGRTSSVHTLLIDRRGLCQAYGKRNPPPPCDICCMFTPTTLRIDGDTSQYPLISIPSSFTFASSLTRLMMAFEPGLPSSSLLEFYDAPYIHQVIPAHITEVVFILSRLPPYNREAPNSKGVLRTTSGLTLSDLGEKLGRWLAEGLAVADRRWIVVGAERFGPEWLPEVHEGVAVFLGAEAAIKAGMGRTLERYGEDADVLERVHFVSLQDYLQQSQTRSELSDEEIARLAVSEKRRRGMIRKKQEEAKAKAERKIDEREVIARTPLRR